MCNTYHFSWALMIMIVCAHTANSQAPDQPSATITCSQECLDSKHRYRFCRPKPGAGTPEVEWYTKCTSNPNNEYDPITGARMKVYRPSITNGTFCSEFSVRANDVAVKFWVNTIQGPKMVYDFTTDASYKACIEEAIREWTSACSTDAGSLNFVSSTWPQNCCLRIIVSNDPNDFPGEFINSPAHARRSGSSASSCDGLACRTPQNNSVPVNESVRILINATPTYRRGAIDGYPRRFITHNLQALVGAGGESALQYLKSKGYEYLDLCSVLKHEIGHIFGFTDDGPEGPPVSEGEDCKDGGGIMAWEADFEDDSWTSKSISASDRCRFQKLYCCAQTVTSVIESDESFSSICTGLTEEVDVAFFSIVGELLYTTRAQCTSDPQEVLNHVRLESGVYLVVVVAKNGGTAQFKIAVTH